jgi:competence protein ComEC
VQLAPSAVDLRVAVPVAVAWTATALLVGVPDVAPLVGGASALLTGVSGIVLRWRRGTGVVPVVAGLLLVAGALTTLLAVSVTVGESRRAPEPLRALVAGPGVDHVEVEAVLNRDLVPGDRSVTATLVRAEELDGLRVPVRLVPDQHGDAPGAVLAAGTRITVTATLQPDEPGSATAFVAFLRRAPSSVPPDGLLGATDTARQAFVRATVGLPQPGAALLRGLAIGDRSGLDPATEAAMETSALTHLTAVSGANCAVVVGLVVVLGRACGLPRGPRAAAAVGVLLVFVVLVRPDPSIVRATVMAIVVLVVHLAGRPVRGVPLIALAAVGMLVVDPWFARSFAFALSVLATSGIVVLGPPLTELLARRVWPPVAAALAIPVAAQVACWPVTIPLSAALPTYAVPANQLAEPFAPGVTGSRPSRGSRLPPSGASHTGRLLCRTPRHPGRPGRSVWSPPCWCAAASRSPCWSGAGSAPGCCSPQGSWSWSVSQRSPYRCSSSGARYRATGRSPRATSGRGTPCCSVATTPSPWWTPATTRNGSGRAWTCSGSPGSTCSS